MVKLFHCCNRFSNGKDERTKGLQQSLCGYNIKRQGYKDDEWSDGIKYFKSTFKRFASSSMEVYLMRLSHCLVYNHPHTEVCTTSGESVEKIIILLDIRQYCAIYLYIKGPIPLLHWYCPWPEENREVFRKMKMPFTTMKSILKIWFPEIRSQDTILSLVAG